MNHVKIALVYTSAIALFLTSCGPSTSEHHGAEQPAVETDFIRLEVEDVDTHKEYPGAIEGIVNIEIKPQVTGYLSEVLVREGDFVQKGQTLFRISPEVYTEQVKNGQAAVKAAIAAQETARLEIEKLRPLVDGKVVTEIQLKTAMATYESAVAQVEQAKASLGSSKINVDFTVVKAPVSGYIGRIPNRKGALVSPADPIALTTLSDISSVQVYFSLSEADYLSYQKSNLLSQSGKQVTLILADGSAYDQQGTLESASGNIDKATGSITMKAVFSNPHKLLRSGGAAKVMLNRTVNNIIQLPKLSVKDIQDKFFVFRLSDSSTVSMVPIEIEGGTKDLYFVKAGVQQGDKIAINRIDMLQDGLKVAAKDTTLSIQ
ncbi:efflux RND transporter periplasmic adaptor subunit [Sphingobacterium faecale]|uniref:Efflux RND transporter periplasmic adaptor subunit n=1 Tax=Sphingobacterium faecale TaxID=2803775 RepID=A0ABS1R2E8_9SPHI|nr:efflux RND transporter periplasmic adaptor subunit [Sphingobacterium faecale]MBL1408475.1 efflux RND transporter periplasmic adaptor subunit [Sphingobacterium faecale]